MPRRTFSTGCIIAGCCAWRVARMACASTWRTSTRASPRTRRRVARTWIFSDIIVRKYAPLPAATLSVLVRRLRYAAPQLKRGIDSALARARRRLPHSRVEGVDWYWPEDENPSAPHEAIDDRVRLLAPFDPIVWDRRRFELLWAWPYRFEAYNPAPKRRFGYYALPLLWREHVIGWANVSAKDGALAGEFGYVESAGAPRDRVFRRELAAEMERMQTFLRT